MQVAVELPVFLPGNNRDWTEVQGRAVISSKGEIIIKLVREEDTQRLIKQAQEGILWQLSLDYKMPVEMIKQINTQHQKWSPDASGS